MSGTVHRGRLQIEVLVSEQYPALSLKELIVQMDDTVVGPISSIPKTVYCIFKYHNLGRVHCQNISMGKANQKN